jgi:uncharacterized protein (TIGR02001 family)
MFIKGTPLLLAGVFALGTTMASWSVSAEEKDVFDSIPGTFSADVALTTDYVYRGTSQTDEHPALQGGIYWENEVDLSGQKATISAGVWGSNVDFNDGDRASVELDWIAGIGTEIGGVGVDLGYLFYSYPGAGSALNYNFHEASIYLSKDFEVASASAGFNWSPNFFGGVDDAYYYDFGVDVPLPFKLTASGHVGFQQFKRSGVDDYVDWSVGISRPVKGIDVSLTYYDTDIDDGGFCGASNDNCTTRFVAAISKAF